MNIIISITGGMLAIGLFGIVVQFQEIQVSSKRNLIIYSYCLVTILSSFILSEHSAYIVFVAIFLIIRSIVFFIKGRLDLTTVLVFLFLLVGNVVIPFLLI